MRKHFYFQLLLSLLIFNPITAMAQNGVSPSAAIDAKMVTAIEVKGNKTISIAQILTRIKTRVGDHYIQSVISDDLKRLYNTGYFADVRVDREEFDGGFRVIIYLEEKPLIEEITFSKTRFYKSKRLQKEIKTQAGKFLDEKILKDDIRTIRELYAKKGLTTADIEVKKTVDDITNKVSLHFVVREGQRIRIKRININGNDSFKYRKIIKTMKTRKKWWFNSGILNDEVLDEDMERIMSFYEQQGFIDAVADYNVDYIFDGWVNVNVEVSEGRRYSVGDIVISGNVVLSDDEINRKMEEIIKGEYFSRERLTVDIANIRSLYFDRGYIFANVLESASIDPDTGRVDVRIDIEEGGVAYIEKVNIRGNTRTRDIVIRRELKLLPGDRFDGAKLRRSKERLTNLGYFEEVDFDIEDTDRYDRKNLVVNVKEAKTGTFSFGGGFSTVDKIVGFVELEQRNFDWKNWPTFTGGGQRLSLRAETGSARTNFRLSFTEPWIFDRPISGGFDVFLTDRDRENDTGYAYDEERVGGQLRLGKRFGEYWAANSFYKFETVNIGNFEAGVSSALLAEGGKNNISNLGFSVTLDKRNSTISPTEGLLWNTAVDFAGGFIGGDKDFYRIQTRTSYYVPFKWDSVLEFRFKTGMIDAYDDTSSVPIFERFFAGGARSIRGYDERGVGPIDSITKDPIGGEVMVIANIEYTIPVIDFIKFAAFLDAGNVWSRVQDFGEDEIFAGTGVGFRIKTPVGPINLDYGYPLNDEPGEESKSGKFYFSVSRGF